jgi:MFS family permease
MSVLCATTSPLLAADSLTLSLYYTRNFTQIALLTGYQLMGVGVAGFLFVASARVWGKRHLFLLGNILMVISSIWGGASNHNFKSLLWARIFQGVALAPFEALVNACVGDLYFVHVGDHLSGCQTHCQLQIGTRETNGCVECSPVW